MMEHMTVEDILKATGGRLLCGPKDLEIRNVSIDSRKMAGADLFVPLVGGWVDAHRFIEEAFAAGAAATLTSEHEFMDSPRPWIYVENTKRALQDVGRYCRDCLTIPIVGITGSLGKTTTREMTAAALSAKFRVFKTPANHNSQVGLPISLSMIGAEDEIGVLELGMSMPGEMSLIAGIARVNMAVITNVGITHIAQLGSRKNIFKEKMAIQDGMGPGGILLLNGDDPMLKDARTKDGCPTLYYGTGENSSFRAEDIRLVDGYPAFTASIMGKKVSVRLGVMGRHNVLNAVAALAVARIYGVDLVEAAGKLSEFSGYQNRQQVYEKNGITIIDDTYNASPASMSAELEVLYSLPVRGRRIAVLADMKELGVEEVRFHRKLGESMAGHRLEVLMTLGGLAYEIEAGARAAGCAISEYFHFPEDGHELLYAKLKEILRPGDCVLLKGSNSMKLGKVAARLLE